MAGAGIMAGGAGTDTGGGIDTGGTRQLVLEYD